MAVIKNIRKFGNSFVATFDDGSTVTLVPTATNLYLANQGGVAQGSGGESGANGGVANNSPGSVSAAVDDYPWPHAPQNELSPLRYSYRDCTDFCAWRINRDNGHTSAPWPWTWAQLRPASGNGDAIGWKGDWTTLGFATNITPVAGCLGYYGSSAGAYGHVNYVQSVAGSNVFVEEYNWGGTQAYGTRTVPVSDFDSFLAMPH